MTLRIIGAGWGRTGTTTMKDALELLGFRCHDMNDLFIDNRQADLFLEAGTDPAFDWERIYGGYEVTLDFPGCVFWRELAAYYPAAKMILTVRPPDAYYESYHATIEDPMTNPRAFPAWNAMVREVLVPRCFDGDPSDREVVIGGFERHNAAVRESVAPDRLLVYSVADGWEPLCAFLECPVPDAPFPRRNLRDQWGSARSASAASSAARALRWVGRVGRAGLGRSSPH